jgi:4-methyl-5(b-hydroxyethyl)-thiazole monophosphate biosynthesis
MKKVLLLLCKGTETYEAAAFYDVLGWAGSSGDVPIMVVVAGSTPEIQCTFGLTLRSDRLLEQIDPEDFDALAIPGGFERFGFYEEAYSERVSDLIRNFNARRKPIAAICVGALAVGRSGALAGRKATTYHLGDGRRRNQLADFGANVLDEKIVRDGNVITSASPETAVEVAFRLLEMITTRHNADLIRHLMGFPSICQIYNFLKISDRITTSGMPMKEEIPLIARSGAKAVISLVPKGVGADLRGEKSQVRAAGLFFERLPVDWQSPEVGDFQSFCTIMEEYLDKQIHVHCEANMRVSVFMALYRMIVEGWTREAAMLPVEEIWRPNDTWQAFMQKVLDHFAGPETRP